jgi:hypothetical protein
MKDEVKLIPVKMIYSSTNYVEDMRAGWTWFSAQHPFGACLFINHTPTISSFKK